MAERTDKFESGYIGVQGSVTVVRLFLLQAWKCFSYMHKIQTVERMEG